MQGEKDFSSTHQRAILSNIQQIETKNVQEIFICITTGSRIVERLHILVLHRHSTVARRVTTVTSEHYGDP